MNDQTETAEAPTTLYMGICDECRSVKWFSTEQRRDGWQKHHPHQEAR